MELFHFLSLMIDEILVNIIIINMLYGIIELNSRVHFQVGKVGILLAYRFPSALHFANGQLSDQAFAFLLFKKVSHSALEV